MGEPGPLFEILLTGATADVAALSRSARMQGLAAMARAPDGTHRAASAWRRERWRVLDTKTGAAAACGAGIIASGDPDADLAALVQRDPERPARRRRWVFAPATPDLRIGAFLAAPDVPDDLRVRLGAERDAPLEGVGVAELDVWSSMVAAGASLIETELAVGRVERWEEGEPAGRDALAIARFTLLKGDRAALSAFVGTLMRESRGALAPTLKGVADRIRDAGRAPIAVTLAKPTVGAETPAADCLAAGLSWSAAQLIDGAPQLLVGRDPEAARRMRVALRRFRAFEKVFRRALPKGALTDLTARAREYARTIGAARDWDVFIGGALLEADARRLGPDAGRTRLRRRAEQMRGAAWTDVEASVAALDFRLFLNDLVAAAEAQPWRNGASERLYAPASAFGARGLERGFAEAAAKADAISLDDLDTLHDLRLAMKKFRYAAQIFRGACPRALRKPAFARMADLQAGLGVLNDAVVAERLARAAAEGQGTDAALASGLIAGARRAEAEGAARRAPDAWRAFLATPRFWRPEEEGERAADPPRRDANVVDFRGTRRNRSEKDENA